MLNPKNVGKLGLEWSYKAGGSVLSSPAVVDGMVYVGSNDYNVYALNAHTGRKLWRYATGNVVWDSSPAVVDGVVYVASADGNLYALNARTGRKVWSYPVYGPDTPAVVNGVVYFGADDDHVYALNARTGTLLWKYRTSYAVRGDVQHRSSCAGDRRSASDLQLTKP